MDIPDILMKLGVKDIRQRRWVYNLAVFLAIAQGIPMVRDMLGVLYNADVFSYTGTLVISVIGLYSALLLVTKKV